MENEFIPTAWPSGLGANAHFSKSAFLGFEMFPLHAHNIYPPYTISTTTGRTISLQKALCYQDRDRAMAEMPTNRGGAVNNCDNRLFLCVLDGAILPASTPWPIFLP